MIIVSAVVRFIPNPPALVERRKQNLEESSALNKSILPFSTSYFVNFI